MYKTNNNSWGVIVQFTVQFWLSTEPGTASTLLSKILDNNSSGWDRGQSQLKKKIYMSEN